MSERKDPFPDPARQIRNGTGNCRMLTPPRMKNDCFALPAGVDWTPVDDALRRLREAVHMSVDSESVPVEEADGRLLAEPVRARRANPPGANSAVDGYGFSHGATGAGEPAAAAR